MSRPGRRYIGWCATLLAVLLLSGHTAGLQLVAWAGMVADRAPVMGLGQALHTTFDGSAPCAVCRVVDHFRAAQQDADQHQPGGPQSPAPTAPQPHLAQVLDLVLPEVLTAPVLIAVLAHDHPAAPRAWVADVPVPPPRST